MDSMKCAGWCMMWIQQLLLVLLLSWSAIMASPFFDSPGSSVDPSAAGATPQEERGVIFLTSHSFDLALREYQPLLVLFDSPARAGSSMVFEQFADAATALRMTQRYTSPHIRFAMVDTTISHDLASRFHVVSVPTFLRFNCKELATSQQGSVPNVLNPSPVVIGTSVIDGIGNLDPSIKRLGELVSLGKVEMDGQMLPLYGPPSLLPLQPHDTLPDLSSCARGTDAVVEYTGAIESLQFQYFLMEHKPKSVVKIESTSEFEVIKKNYPFVVLVVADSYDSQAYRDIKLLASMEMGIAEYVVSTNPYLLESWKEHFQIPRMVLYRDFGTSRLAFDNHWNKWELFPFIQRNRYPPVSTYKSAFPQYYFEQTAGAHLVLVSDASQSYHAPLMEAATNLAPEYNPRWDDSAFIRFIHVPADAEAFRNALLIPMDAPLPAILLLRDQTQEPNRHQRTGTALRRVIMRGDAQGELRSFIETAAPVGSLFGWSSVEPTTGLYAPFKVNQSASVRVQRMGTSSTGVNVDVDADAEEPPLEPFHDPPTRAPRISLAELLGKVDARNESFMMAFISSRCGTCKQFKVDFEKVAQVVASGETLWQSNMFDALPPLQFYVLHIDQIDTRKLPVQLELLPEVFFFPAAHVQSPLRHYTARDFSVDALLAFVNTLAPLATSPMNWFWGIGGQCFSPNTGCSMGIV